MKVHRILIFHFLLIIFLGSSCVSHKDLTYLQYKDINDAIPDESIIPEEYKIQPYDILYIRVLTPDPQWSSLFNTMPVGAGGALTEESASLVGYPVDDSGNIEIPFVGEVNVVGKTLSEIKVQLDAEFKNYVTNAAITVRLVSNSISIIGEVISPGKYPMPKNRMNIFEALAMAGDLDDYSNRQQITIIRPSPYGPIIREFSLTDRSILSSEFYYVRPNDIIYAKPLKLRSFQMNSSTYSMILSLISTTLTLIVLVITTQ